MKITHYLIPVLFGTLSMFGLSYLWHGVILNDFERLDISEGTFYSFLLLFYVCLSVCFTFLFRHLNDKLQYTAVRITIGVVTGFLLYLFAYLMGVTFQSGGGMKHLVIDFGWQMAEQGFGAFVIGALVLTTKRVFSMQD